MCDCWKYIKTRQMTTQLLTFQACGIYMGVRRSCMTIRDQSTGLSRGDHRANLHIYHFDWRIGAESLFWRFGSHVNHNHKSILLIHGDLNSPGAKCGCWGLFMWQMIRRCTKYIVTRCRQRIMFTCYISNYEMKCSDSMYENVKLDNVAWKR